jgi:hypothetical protein
MFYQVLIRAFLEREGLAGVVKPHHVEAWMREINGTLDHLSPDEFYEELRAAAGAAHSEGPEVSEALADCLGLREEPIPADDVNLPPSWAAWVRRMGELTISSWTRA